jgi:hypothetical protein
LVDQPRYAQVEQITLVCDNLNTHHLASLYQAFEPAEAQRIARKLELVPTPKQGSWLSVLTRPCLNRHIARQTVVADESAAWSGDRNARQIGLDWHFTIETARTKLKHLYPKILL